MLPFDDLAVSLAANVMVREIHSRPVGAFGSFRFDSGARAALPTRVPAPILSAAWIIGSFSGSIIHGPTVAERRKRHRAAAIRQLVRAIGSLPAEPDLNFMECLDRIGTSKNCHTIAVLTRHISRAGRLSSTVLFHPDLNPEEASGLLRCSVEAYR